LTQACAPGQPLCGFRGVEHPASQAGTLDSSGYSATPFFNPCSGTKCLPQNGVAGGHINAAEWRLLLHARSSLVLSVSRIRTCGCVTKGHYVATMLSAGNQMWIAADWMSNEGTRFNNHDNVTSSRFRG